MAMKSANVAARVEPEIKEQAEAILASLGLSARLCQINSPFPLKS